MSGGTEPARVNAGADSTTATPIGCPSCGEQDPLRIVYGYPTHEMFQASQRGEFALGGCVIERTSPDWRCRQCGNEWADGNGPRLEGVAGVWMDDRP